MTKIITPINECKTISPDQIGGAADRFAERCRKGGDLLLRDAAQYVLDNEGDALAQEMFEVLRKRVERRSKMIVRRVTVNRDSSPQWLIDRTGRKQYFDRGVLETMPRQGTGIEEVEVYFFNAGGFLSTKDWRAELAAAGLEPDYYAQVQVHIDDPSFADEHMNYARWVNEDGKVFFLTFYRTYNGHRAVADCHVRDWDGDWLAGRLIRKPA